jgi:CRISPR/Cas system-associated exonuclease Cas4 (RecB family)
MPAHRIVVAPQAASRREEARRWLTEVAGTGPVLLVSTALEAADHFLRELASERGSLFGFRRATLDSLAYRLALPALAREGMTTASRLAQEAVTARLLHVTASEKRLGPLAEVASGPGLIRALTSTIHECRLHQVRAEELSKLGDLGETLGLLLMRYEEMSREQGVADRALTLTLAREGAADIEGPMLLLDVPLENPLEAALIEVVARRPKAAPVLATAVEADEATLARLSRALGCEPDVPPGSGSADSALLDLQRHVFGATAPPRRERPEDVVVLSAPGEAQEAAELARAIQLEAEKGLPFDRVAVLLRSPEVYTPLLEDAFDRAGIPAYFENGTKRPDPAGRAFLALLDCAAEELSATRFAEYLSLSQLPKLDALGAPIVAPSTEEEDVLWVPPRHSLAPEPAREPVQLDLFAEPPPKVEAPENEPVLSGTLRAPWRWEKLLVDAAVIGGRDRWERRLSGLGRELDVRLLETEDQESVEAERLRRERNDLLHLRNFALPLIETLDTRPANEDASWGVWIDWLERLAVSSLSSPEGVLALLKELRPMTSVGPVSILEVREVLSERLTLLPQRPSGDRYGKVWVAPIEAARGMSFEMVLVPGLAERMFPRKIVEDPLLLDSFRLQLHASLPLQKDRIAKERLFLRLAIGAASRKIVFSYPSVDLAKGRAKVPSFYLLEVARASQGELPDFETLAREAASSSGARLGWPAPRDRGQAIDAAEFDLAFLSDSLREAGDRVTLGSGRYLVQVNPALARSLRARYQRGRSGHFTTADGFLEASEAARAVLAQHRLEARAYSVTALEKYAACPYRFYLNAILRIRPRETVEAVTHLDPLTKGSILHAAQFEILKRLGEAGLLPAQADNIDEVLQLFEVVFDEVQDRFEEDLAPAIGRIWKDELERIRFDLRGWLRREALREEGFVPYRREFTFGMRPTGPADPASTLEVAVLKNGLRLRGAIDLVEKRATDGKVRVTDHKSGKAWMPEGAVVNGGENLQPILYTLAYEALTGEEVDSARLYYVTQRAGYVERVVRADEEALAVVAEFQRRLDEVIEEGFFPASPLEKPGCKYCDYLAVCGPRMQIDARRKQNDPRLSPLNWLRSLT